MKHGLALGPGALQGVGLLRDFGLGLRTRLEVLQVGDQVEGVKSRSIDRRDASVVTSLLEQQAAILRRDPPGSPNATGVGGCLDVRHVELVAGDLYSGTRDALVRPRARAVEAEALGLEVLGEVVEGDVVEERRQAVVHLRLRVRPGRNGDTAVLTRGNDVAGGLREVLGGGARWLDGQPNSDDGSGYDSPPTRHADLSSTSSGFI